MNGIRIDLEMEALKFGIFRAIEDKHTEIEGQIAAALDAELSKLDVAKIVDESVERHLAKAMTQAIDTVVSEVCWSPEVRSLLTSSALDRIRKAFKEL